MNPRAPYVALGLEPGAPSVEIKRAFRNLTLKYHPDASRSPGTAKRFARVVKAYKILSTLPEDDRSAMARLPTLPDTGASDLFDLGRSLVASPSAEERSRAARLLGLSGKRSAWIFLRKGLYDTDSRVVGACIRAAAALGLAQGGAEIASAYTRCGPAVRDAVLEAARVTADPVLFTALEAAASDEDPGRRVLARELRKLALSTA